MILFCVTWYVQSRICGNLDRSSIFQKKPLSFGVHE